MNSRPPQPQPKTSQPCSPPPHLTLDERQHRLISLLLDGHTDVSAAQRLGVSPRTVTNILRSLMNRLGVDNRFQLGVALGTHLRTGNGPVADDGRPRVQSQGGPRMMARPSVSPALLPYDGAWNGVWNRA
ncbi:helix-turn-helix transcriptional regulator [Streptomyces sp. NPDC086787]|uniref:helix-turn-helix domain-containing protein n=1 Tax=Streptomyces sp. NPDC086787 TaxID=3365759 RepID=UPI0038170CED